MRGAGWSRAAGDKRDEVTGWETEQGSSVLWGSKAKRVCREECVIVGWLGTALERLRPAVMQDRLTEKIALINLRLGGLARLGNLALGQSKLAGYLLLESNICQYKLILDFIDPKR